MAYSGLLELEADEQEILMVRRTKIGLIPILVSGVVVIVGLLLAVYFIARFQTTVNKTIPVSTALIIVIGLALLAALILIVSLIVYLGNQMLVTNERIVSFIQNSLFAKELAQLELDNVEDVTIKQTGIFPSLFNYGTLIVQTAGQMDNFVFKLARSPYQAAKIIRDTVEQFGQAPVHETGTEPAPSPPITPTPPV